MQLITKRRMKVLRYPCMRKKLNEDSHNFFSVKYFSYITIVLKFRVTQNMNYKKINTPKKTIVNKKFAFPFVSLSVHKKIL